jgi:hypothetical protein
MGCKRSDTFLEDRGIAVRETVDARKVRYGKSDLKKLFKGAGRIVTARGKKSVEFDLREGFPKLDELAKATLGPSGNLRAPALKLGKDWVIGFGEPAWEEYFG